jgi:hypothetical protein
MPLSNRVPVVGTPVVNLVLFDPETQRWDLEGVVELRRGGVEVFGLYGLSPETLLNWSKFAAHAANYGILLHRPRGTDESTWSKAWPGSVRSVAASMSSVVEGL